MFKLYEENIGPLTPLIADALKDAEEKYPANGLRKRLRLAVKNNKRNWKYVEAILKRWKEEGKHGKKDQQNPDKSSERYTDSEFAEFSTEMLACVHTCWATRLPALRGRGLFAHGCAGGA